MSAESLGSFATAIPGGDRFVRSPGDELSRGCRSSGMSAGNDSLAPASSEADVESSTGMPRMCEMTEHDNQLSSMMRRAGANAPQSAPPALGEKLKNEFRRHHIRRRRERNARMLLVAASLGVSVMTFVNLRPRPSQRTSNVAAVRGPVQTSRPTPANVA